ncbi:MAG: aspartate--tRNA(Asn) ligase [Candidatus Micrarchaeota archaeon]
MMRTHYASEVTPELEGQTVTIAGWAHEIRDLGKLKFLILRDRTGLIQVTAKKGTASESVLEQMNLIKESVIQITGKVRKESQAPGARELIPESVKNLNPISSPIPFEVTGKVPVDLDVRLDNRCIDFRRIPVSAIFQIKHWVQYGFREKAYELGFQEIVPTCIAAAASEGGSNLFPVVYFEKEAYLCQSPQLYKQLAVIGGMDKVFMMCPAFRAEKHNTTSHLNEVLQMDIEMGFADHNDAMEVLSAISLNILKNVKEHCPKELEILNSNIIIPDEVKRHTYESLINLLNSHDTKIEWGEDFSREHERKLYDVLKEELYLITDWPTKIRAFYSMPNESKPEICNSYDLMYKGIEISSGAQRIHLPDLLVKQLRDRGLNPENFEFYIKAFRMGAPPHAGWSIGLERISMQLCNQQNIRECAMFPRDRNRITP